MGRPFWCATGIQIFLGIVMNTNNKGQNYVCLLLCQIHYLDYLHLLLEMQRSLYSNFYSQLNNDLTSGQHNLLFKNHNKEETTTINVACSARIIKFQLQRHV